MPRQIFLPGFPEGATKIGGSLSVLQKDGVCTYFVGSDNYYSHRNGDKQSQRFALATLMENGHVRARDLEGPPFNIPHRSLMNWGKKLRKGGPSSFFHSGRRPHSRVMTPEKAAESGQLLDVGLNPSDVARRVGINDSTLRKAIKRKAVRRIKEDKIDLAEG